MWSPMDGLPIWSIAIDPVDTQTVFVGVKPAVLFRCRDGGSIWTQLSVQMGAACHIGPPLVIMLRVDPQAHRIVWAGVAVDGVSRSLDGGDTWTHMAGGVPPDMHGMALSLGAPKQVLASTPRAIVATPALGASWPSVVTTERFPLRYSRGIAIKPDDPNVICAALGDTARGSTGAIHRATDGGATWETRPLPVEPNANLWSLATPPAAPQRVLAASLCGELYASHEAGDSWQKLKRECSEIGALVWAPNS